MRVAALIPAYQAAARIGEVLAGLAALEPRLDVLVVDDGSRDGTGDIARAAGARVLTFPVNHGKGYALAAGFAALVGFDAVVALDADGQHPPARVPALIAAAEAGADLVLGVRGRTPDMPVTRRFANGFSSGWASALAGRRVSDSQCGFRLYRRDVIVHTPVTPGRYEFETEIVVRACRLGFRVAEVEIPTVYGEERSQIRAFRDVPRIVAVLARLSLESVLPSPAMRRALAARRAHAAADRSGVAA